MHLAECFPRHAGINKRVHTPDFKKVKKTKRQFIVNCFQLAVPDCWGTTVSMLGLELVAPQPSSDSPSGNTR